MDEKKRSPDAFQWAYDKYIGSEAKEDALYEEERIKADVAQAVYNIRNQASLSGAQLANRVGTTESVIAHIEEADYDGNFPAMA